MELDLSQANLNDEETNRLLDFLCTPSICESISKVNLYCALNMDNLKSCKALAKFLDKAEKLVLINISGQRG